MMLSENDIEFIVEKTTDKLDRQLMDGKLSQEEYDLEMNKLDMWAEQQFNKIAA